MTPFRRLFLFNSTVLYSNKVIYRTGPYWDSLAGAWPHQSDQGVSITDRVHMLAVGLCEYRCNTNHTDDSASKLPCFLLFTAGETHARTVRSLMTVCLYIVHPCSCGLSVDCLNKELCAPQQQYSANAPECRTSETC